MRELRHPSPRPPVHGVRGHLVGEARQQKRGAHLVGALGGGREHGTKADVAHILFFFVCAWGGVRQGHRVG